MVSRITLLYLMEGGPAIDPDKLLKMSKLSTKVWPPKANLYTAVEADVSNWPFAICCSKLV